MTQTSSEQDIIVAERMVEKEECKKAMKKDFLIFFLFRVLLLYVNFMFFLSLSNTRSQSLCLSLVI